MFFITSLVNHFKLWRTNRRRKRLAAIHAASDIQCFDGIVDGKVATVAVPVVDDYGRPLSRDRLKVLDKRPASAELGLTDRLPKRHADWTAPRRQVDHRAKNLTYPEEPQIHYHADPHSVADQKWEAECARLNAEADAAEAAKPKRRPL